MNETVDIRYLSDCPEVIPILASWVFDQWGQRYEIESPGVQVKLFANRTNQDKIPLAFVAFSGSQPVGTASLKIQEMTTHPHLGYWLGEVFVVEEFRGRGIGTELILRATDKAHELGVETLYLHTPDKIILYSRLGWEEIERPIYCGQEVAIMKKTLAWNRHR